MNNNEIKQGGFMQLILIIVIAFLLMRYFHITVSDIVEWIKSLSVPKVIDWLKELYRSII